MHHPAPNSVVHLELHTGNLARACDFYAKVCGWRLERLEVGGCSYHALDCGDVLAGGVVECQARQAMWLPYVEVPHIGKATESARRSGASVRLDVREGPCGWRSVVAVPEGAEIAFWQAKTPAGRGTGAQGH